jgi:Holliday junction DNA helicase RuvA
MIGSLKGVVAAVGEDSALIEVGGVGYLVQAGARTLSRLAVGQGAALLVETHVREDAIKLFGFLSDEERGWFVVLQSVQGVGAKVALAILDALGPDGISDALALSDKASFARANGVGPKLAARIAQELAGKPGPKGFIAGAAKGVEDAPVQKTVRSDAVSALVNLGVEQAIAARAVAQATKTLGADAELPALIRAALKEASGG